MSTSLGVPPNPGIDRRDPAMPRVPFEALVELGAPDGACFEAESIDLSASGMHLRTAYLPKVGTPLTFRFEPSAEAANAILASGEVVWAHDGPQGSEFGVRFDDLRGEHADALRKILDRSPDAPNVKKKESSGDACTPLKTLAGVGPISKPESVEHPAIAKGAGVRIHIEGVQAPMRATMRDDAPAKGAIVGSELKMLRIGTVIELEDKERHTKRPARVEAVECEVDSARVPQLVVKLRYDLEGEANAFATTTRVPSPSEVRATLPPPASTASSADETSESVAQSLQTGRFDAVADGMKDVGKKMGAAMTAAFSSMGSAAAKVGARAKTTVALLTKRGETNESGDEPVRRTTSPAPNGAAGKPRTLRPQGASRDSMHGEGNEEGSGVMQEIDSKKVARRRQIGIIAAIVVAVVLGFIAFRKPKHATPPTATAPAPELAPAPPPRVETPPPAALPDPALAANATPAAVPLQGDPTGLDSKGNPNPFGNTSVKKGTRMVLRLDGPVAELRGTQMPNGFVISVPNRKSIEAAGPLAAKDGRISSAKVVNQPLGAELTIAFKDEPPNYVVRAKGDAIEIVLAKEKAVAKKKAGGAKKAPAAGAAKGAAKAVKKGK